MNKSLGWRAHLYALAGTLLVLLVGLIGVHEMVSPFRSRQLPLGRRENIGELVGSSQACQTFIAEYPGLSCVEVRLLDYGRQNLGPFTFHLCAAPGESRDIVTLTHDASSVRSGDYYAFEFPPLPDSAGRSYRFCLEAPDAVLLNSITVQGTLEDAYPAGEATFREMWGQSAGVRDLVFRLGYTLSFSQKLAALAERLTEYKPFLCGDWRFYVLLFALYPSLLYLLFFRMMRRSEDAGD
jgi:hypothetical protein